MPTETIQRVYFQKKTEPGLECEILRFEKLRLRNLPDLWLTQRLSFYMLFFVTAGQGIHTLDFRHWPIAADDLIFIAPGQVHQFHRGVGVDGLLILFTEGFFSQQESDRMLLATSGLFDPWNPAPVLRLPTEQRQAFRQDLRSLAEEYLRGPLDTIRPALLHTQLKTLLLRADRLRQVRLGPAHSAAPAEFLRFKALVEKQFSATRTLGDYAAELGSSPRRLSRLSTQAVGLDAKAFIDERVMLEGRRLLAHTDLGLKEITSALGFDEPTNFVKFFKHREGQTPMDFRAAWSPGGTFLP